MGIAVTISGYARTALVVLVRFDPKIIRVPILRGENGGPVLPHRNIVREVTVLGTFTGESHSYHIPGGRNWSVQ
ncbi:DUF1223 domain-containing protein [Gluconobacter sp. OJB]|uniref:DUF1223 domain-containing protein n=1 Tax=Gluconobacter sp. OJB TaxID=3145196 RepID=UPI0031F7D95F